MEKRLEDRELSLQGGEVVAAKGSAMGSVGGGEGGAILESRETYTSAGGHGSGDRTKTSDRYACTN